MSAGPSNSTGGGYRRPMTGWWLKTPAFRQYMLREVTSFFVCAYALMLLCGVVALARGEAAWGHWIASLKTPSMLAYHGVILVFMIIHAWTWFGVMPKTLPPIRLAGKRLSAAAITGSGRVAIGAATVVVLILIGRLGHG